jgi:hypothetical protein
LGTSCIWAISANISSQPWNAPVYWRISAVPYDVTDYLRTPKERAAYLGACIEDGDAAVIAQARKDMARALRLSRKDAHKVLALLKNPPKPNKRLKAAVKTHKGVVQS